jgi:hypothetical protein
MKALKTFAAPFLIVIYIGALDGVFRLKDPLSASRVSYKRDISALWREKYKDLSIFKYC